MFEEYLPGSESLGVIAGALIVGMALSGVAGSALRRMVQKSGKLDDQEGYIVSAVLGLLALLMGFTFALASERHNLRRDMVVQEANALGTAYLRFQLLPSPDRERLSGTIHEYTRNRLVLSGKPRADLQQRLARNDELLADLWEGTEQVWTRTGNTPLSSLVTSAVNDVIDADTSRRAARYARVPGAVLDALAIYAMIATGILGFVLREKRGRLAAGILALLLTLSIVLIIDIDRPTSGRISESQWPIENTLDYIEKHPPRVGPH